MKKFSFNPKLTFLGIVGIAVSVAVLTVNPFSPQNFRGTPENMVSPVINYVHVALYDADGNNVDASWDAREAEMGVSLNN